MSNICQRAKNTTLDAFIRAGVKHQYIKFPILILFAVFLFIYHLLKDLLVHFHIRNTFSKAIAVVMTGCFVLGTLPSPGYISTVFAEADSSPRHVAIDDAFGTNVFLGNSKMELGISPVGTFGATAPAPTSGEDIFHPASSHANHIGLRSNPWSNTNDYFLPGTVDEGYVITWSNSTEEGVSASSLVQSNSVGRIKNICYTPESNLDTSSSSTLSTATSGSALGTIHMCQNASFVQLDGGLVKMEIALKNTSADPVYNLEYIRGFDPDQCSGSSNTNNYFYVEKEGDDDDSGTPVGTVWVCASTESTNVGEKTFQEYTSNAQSPFIFIAQPSSSYTVTPVQQKVGWNNYRDFVDVTDTSGTYQLGQATYEDNGIGLHFHINKLDPDEETTITYYFSLDSDIANAINMILNTLNGTLNYQSEQLSGLDANAEYQIELLEPDDRTITVTTDGSGNLILEGTDTNGDSYSLIGTEITISKIDEDTGNIISQTVNIPSRPDTPATPKGPTGTLVKPEVSEESEVEITETSVTIAHPVIGQEYSLDGGSTWTKCENAEPIVFDALQTHQEYALITRVPSSAESFASISSEPLVIYTQPMLKNMSIHVSSFHGEYDGMIHSPEIWVEGSPDAVISYSTSEDDAFSTEVPSFRNAGDSVIYYRIEKEGFYPLYNQTAIQIIPKDVTIANVTVTDKEYDGSTEAFINTPGALIGKLEADDLSIGNGTANFLQAIPGANIQVNFTGYTLEGESKDNYHLIDQPASVTANITNINQIAPVVTHTNETYAQKHDGTITDVNSTMEYRKEGADVYIPIFGTQVTDLEPGTYYVRYCSKQYYNASADTEVVISPGRKIEIILPEIQTGYQLTSNVASVNYNEDVTLVFQLSDGYNTTSAFQITSSSGEIGEGILLDDTIVYQLTGLTEDAHISVTGVADLTLPELNIKLDTNSWQSFLHTITFSLFFHETQSVQVSCTDKGSGIETISYYVDDTPMLHIKTSEELQAVQSWRAIANNGTFTIDPNKRGVIYAKAVDRAGNITYVCSDGIVLDNAPPVITGITEGAVYCDDISFLVTDENLDTVMVDDTLLDLSERLYKIPCDGESHTIVATDKAGNCTTNTIHAKGHEWSAPSFAWSDDYKTCKALFTCKNNSLHIKVVDCTITCEVTTSATGTDGGHISYTATVALNGTEYTDTKVFDSHIIENVQIGNGSLTTEVIVPDNVPYTTVRGLSVAAARSMLSEEENAAITSGEHIYIFMEVHNITEHVSAYDQKEVTQQLSVRKEEITQANEELKFDKDSKEGCYYLDISLYKKVGDSDPEKLYKTENIDIELTIDLPENMRFASDYAFYQMVRVHYDKDSIMPDTQYLPATIDKDLWNIKFNTDRYSTYAITYLIPSERIAFSNIIQIHAPQLGDYEYGLALLIIWILILASGLAMALLARVRYYEDYVSMGKPMLF